MAKGLSCRDGQSVKFSHTECVRSGDQILPGVVLYDKGYLRKFRSWTHIVIQH